MKFSNMHILKVVKILLALLMKEENTNLYPNYKNDESTDSNKNSKKTKKTDENLQNSNIETNNSSTDSFQGELNNSFLEYINSETSKSLVKKYAAYIKSSFDEKHKYKYFHQQIMSDPNTAEKIKNLYTDYYSDIEEQLRTIRTEIKNKESTISKLTPYTWETINEVSQKLIDNLSLEINELINHKTTLKNSLLFLQYIVLKNLEKIEDFTDIANYVLNNNIDYIEIVNENSDSYKILEFLKEVRYKGLVRDGGISKYNSLDNNEKLEFLKYIASNLENKPFASDLFGNNLSVRIDIYNHYISNEFWIDIYSDETYQMFAENFYELSGITIDSLPNIPFWGIIILSRKQELSNEEIGCIINYFLQPQLPKIISNLENIIDDHKMDTHEISENQYNLIHNMSNYLKAADTEAIISIPLKSEHSYSDSIKKFKIFILIMVIHVALCTTL